VYNLIRGVLSEAFSPLLLEYFVNELLKKGFKIWISTKGNYFRSDVLSQFPKFRLRVRKRPKLIQQMDKVLFEVYIAGTLLKNTRDLRVFRMFVHGMDDWETKLSFREILAEAFVLAILQQNSKENSGLES
jgi:hypothetical protein